MLGESEVGRESRLVCYPTETPFEWAFSSVDVDRRPSANLEGSSHPCGNVDPRVDGLVGQHHGQGRARWRTFAELERKRVDSACDGGADLEAGELDVELFERSGGGVDRALGLVELLEGGTFDEGFESRSCFISVAESLIVATLEIIASSRRLDLL